MGLLLEVRPPRVAPLGVQQVGVLPQSEASPQPEGHRILEAPPVLEDLLGPPE